MPPLPTLPHALPDNSTLMPPVLVEIGFFDEADAPDELRRVPLTRYLAELDEFQQMRAGTL